MTTPAQPRSPLFWILLMAGIGVAGCCFMSAAVLALGAFAGDAEPVAGSGTTGGTTGSPGGGEWLNAVEVARGDALTQPLSGGRWVAQYGSIVDNVIGRAGNTKWVQTNSSGSLYELVFDDDGSYVWNTVSSVTMGGMTYSSRCTEKGAWALSGAQLTLTPESQFAEYSNSGGTQEKNDQDLGARQYTVVDLTLETIDDAKTRVPALLMSGPRAAWDTASGDGVNLRMQRLTSR